MRSVRCAVLELQGGRGGLRAARDAGEVPLDALGVVEQAGERLAEQAVVVAAEQPAGGGVGVQDAVVLVDLDHPFAHQREHGVQVALDVQQLPRHLAGVELLDAEDDGAPLLGPRAALQPAEGVQDVGHRVLDAPLGDVGVGAERENRALVLAGDPRQDDDRDRGVEGVLLQEAGQALPVEPRHDQVEQDDIGELLRLDEAVEGLEPVVGFGHLVAGLRQVRGNQLDDRGVVVDHKDFPDFRHGRERS